MNRTSITAVTALTAAFAVSGCAKESYSYDAESPEMFRADEHEPAYHLDDDVEASVTRVPVTMSRYVARVCDIPEPKFFFDSDTIKRAAQPQLDELALCLQEGGLKGQRLSLVGHADERGPFQYNMALGQERAGAVEDYLVRAGIDRSRIVTSSLGEIEADSKNGFADDRRVEIHINLP